MAHDNPVTDNPMYDLDPRLLELIETQVNSFIKLDLIRFFHDNPHAVETAPNIARLTGRDTRVIESELVELAQQNVLFVHVLSGMRVYSLNDDKELRDLLDAFIAACDDREFRIKAIYHVIRSLR